MWQPYLPAVPPERQREWLSGVVAAKETHVLLSRKWDYQGYTDYSGINGKGELSEQAFADLCRRVYEEYGLFALPVLSFPDDQGGAQAIYDGRMERELEPLARIVDMIGPVSPGFEVCSAWRTKQVADAGTLCRKMLGDNGLIVLHGRDNERCTPASFHGNWPVSQLPPAGFIVKPYPDGSGLGALIEDDDPSHGDEIGAWFVPGIDEYDYFFWQSRHGGDGPSFTNGDNHPNSGTWLGRAIECWERFAPPDTFMPTLNRFVREIDPRTGDRAPDWFAGPRKRGRPCFSAWELQWVESSRGQCDESRIPACANLLAGYGLTHFGSGLPQ